jgi:elongation factor Ts
MEISAGMVKKLREKTSAGIMDCKRALIEMGGDPEAAEELLRKKGLMDAARKAVRVAADGLVAVHVSDDWRKASIIELNSETDFVARNDMFQKVAKGIAKAALENDSVQRIALSNLPGSNESVCDEIKNLISLVGENINLRRAKNIGVKNGIVVSYVHGQVSDGMGRIGVLVSLEFEKEFEVNGASEFGRKIAMHVAATSPLYLREGDVPQMVIDREDQICMAQASESGKPPEIAAKMTVGRRRKFFEEVVLYEQTFVMDGKTKVRDVIEEYGRESGGKVVISEFVLFVLGDGIEKCEEPVANVANPHL